MHPCSLVDEMLKFRNLLKPLIVPDETCHFLQTFECVREKFQKRTAILIEMETSVEVCLTVSSATAPTDKEPPALTALVVHSKRLTDKFSGIVAVQQLAETVRCNVAKQVLIQYVEVAWVHVSVAFHNKIAVADTVHAATFGVHSRKHCDVVVECPYAQ